MLTVQQNYRSEKHHPSIIFHGTRGLAQNCIKSEYGSSDTNNTICKRNVVLYEFQYRIDHSDDKCTMHPEILSMWNNAEYTRVVATVVKTEIRRREMRPDRRCILDVRKRNGCKLFCVNYIQKLSARPRFKKK